MTMNIEGRVSIISIFVTLILASTATVAWTSYSLIRDFHRATEIHMGHQAIINQVRAIPALVPQFDKLSNLFQQEQQEMSSIESKIRKTLFACFALTIVFISFAALMLLRSIRLIENRLTKIVSESHDSSEESYSSFSEVQRIQNRTDLLAKKVEELASLRRVLDEMPVNIMIADRRQNWSITYLNRTSRETLKSIESELAVPIDQVLGSSIDIFHKNPRHQREMLENEWNLPHRAKIKLGHDTLDLRVSALHDSQGAYSAALLTWSLVTANVRLADDFENDVARAVECVSIAASRMKDSANILSSAAVETGSQAISVAKSSDQVSTNVSTVASATEELSASIADISQRMQEASHSIRQVVDQAQLANHVMNELSVAADDIKEVAKMIDSIAAQINLLALNATIESARAGEAGKGFAVVASEIKNLANESSKATTEISKRIETVVLQSRNAVQALTGIQEEIGHIHSVTTAVAGAVAEQRAATAEIACNVGDVTEQVKSVSANVEGMSQVAEDSGRLATEVLGQASALGEEGSRLKEAVESFLLKVRAL